MVPIDKSPHSGIGTRRVSAFRLSRAGIVLLVLVAVVGTFLWFYVPIEVCRSINERLDKLPDYRGHVGRVQINIFTISVDVIDVNLVKRSADLAYPLFYSHQVNVSVHWKALLHGHLRNTVTIYEPKLNFIAGSSNGLSQLSVTDLITEIKSLALFEINRILVTNGDLFFRDFHSAPPLSLEMDQINVTASNLTNGNGLKSHLPCQIIATGRPLRSGSLNLTMSTNLDLKKPTFTEKLEIRKVSAVALNSGLEKYLNVRAKSGDFELFSVLDSEYGDFQGYAKPFLENLEFEPTNQDEGTPIELWADILNGVKKLLENHYDTIATRVQLTGSFNDPQVSTLSALWGVLKNAYIQVLKKGFEPVKTDSDRDEKPAVVSSRSTALPGVVSKDSSKPR